MDINEIKKNVAANIAALRASSGWTQAQLAEKLNYTDKAVSKWERGESVPDVAVLKTIADLFGVTIDRLIAPESDALPADKSEAVDQPSHSRHLEITLLSAVGVGFLAAAAFVLLLALDIPHAWLAFIYALPLAAVDLLVFNALWGIKRWNFYCITLILWTTLTAIYVTLGLTASGWRFWTLFTCGVPLQAAVFLWARLAGKTR